MTVAKGDSHQTNPWAIVPIGQGVRPLSVTSEEIMNIQGGHLGSKCHKPLTFIPSLAIERNRGNSTLTLYKLFTYSLNGLVCFKLLIPLQNIGCK